MSFMEDQARMRGLLKARAEAPTPSDPATVFAELKTAVEAMRTEHQKDLAAIRAGLGDYVQSEKVDRINADISALQKTLDEIAVATAALQAGGGAGGDGGETREQREYGQAFTSWFRHGDGEDKIKEMQASAAASTQSDPDGGFVVPTQMESTIDRVLTITSTVRAVARVMRISGRSYKKFVNRGGSTAVWVGEKDARPETATPRLAGIEFVLQELSASPATTQRLLDDAALDIAQWLADEVSIEFTEAEGAAFVSGDGVNKPKGFLAYPTVVNTNYAWGKIGFEKSGNASAFADTDPGNALIDLVYALRAGYRQNGQFMMNDLTAAAVRKMTDAQGRYLWQEGLQAGEPARLLGYATRTDDNMPDIAANAFPIAFADWARAYLIIDGAGIRVLRDPYTSKPNVIFYTTKRVGGGVQNYEALKLLK
ncbi:MAG: phage major capsid protein, partial [Pseudomonadota bacterium]